MIDIYLDKSRSARLRARVNEASVPKTFAFFNSDGSSHDISSYDFKLFLYVRANTRRKLFTLSIGDGLEVTGDDSNHLQISISQDRATQNADTYFWRLWSESEDHTWMNGPFEFNNGESHVGAEESDAVTNVILGFDYTLDFEIQ
jgi:hypothetical protein